MNLRTFTLLSALAATVAVHAQIDPSRVIVKVNGEPIIGRDYYKRLEGQSGLFMPTGGQFVPTYPGYLALRALIEEELVVQLAKSQGVGPTQSQVDAELTAKKVSNPEQINALISMGVSEAEMKRKILIEQSEYNVVTRGITITDFEIEKYYADNPTKFRLLKRYDLSIVRVATEDDKKVVDAALARGDKFAEIARQYSTDLSKFDGGKIGVFNEEEMVPATRTAISATAKGKVTGWVELNGQFAKFMVDNVLQEEVLKLDQKLKDSIRRQLMLERGQARNNVPLMIMEFRKTIKLEFGDYPFKEQIKQYFELGG